MKYIKGDRTYKLDDCKFIKLRLTDGNDFSETPWGKQYKDESTAVLMNHALAFTPHPSWGAIVPVGTFNFLTMLNKKELTLHPEAWESYLKEGVIDEQGNYIPEEE